MCCMAAISLKKVQNTIIPKIALKVVIIYKIILILSAVSLVNRCV